MRTPHRSEPVAVARWAVRLSLLRWLDAALAWWALWIALGLALEGFTWGSLAVTAAAGVGLAALVAPLRAAWRPVSAAVGLSVSRGLRPGDRAWYVGSHGSELVLVTGRRGLDIVVARGNRDASEGALVSRTRALLLPAD